MSDEVEIDNLEAYDSDEDIPTTGADGKDTSQEDKKDSDTYVTIHSASFRDFMLKPELMRAIGDCGFEHPSTVQNECLPKAIYGVDVLCQAKSGMGKTAVFVLAVLQQLEPKDNEVSALILCHTRELAYQICHEFDRFKKYTPAVKAGVFFGGTPEAEDRARLKNDPPHIVIGTPGRILSLSNPQARWRHEGMLKLDNLKFFVLDECDKMLDTLDMRRDVQQIFSRTPHSKQVMMFTATLSDEIRPVCKKFMNSPLEIYINDGSKLTLHGLQQYYVELQEEEKNRKLVDLLDSLEFNQVVIFVQSVSRAHALNQLLTGCSFPSICIHGRMLQADRIAKYKQFKDFKARIMVSTNVLGRGIDIERVNVVINYDMAENADTYLHRVGRAGRFGTKGLAISFISSAENGEVLNDVQSRFVVNIPKLPDTIDPSTYMTS